MITVSINNQATPLPLRSTVSDAITTLNMVQQQFAVAVNCEFITRGNYASTQLNDGDEIDIVSPIQGG